MATIRRRDANITVDDIIRGKIEDGLKRHCESLGYGYIRSLSSIEEFRQGIQISSVSYEIVGRIPVRRYSESMLNLARRGLPLQERLRRVQSVFSRTTRGLSARLRPAPIGVEIGGNFNVNNEERREETTERHRQLNIAPGMAQRRHEENYLETVSYTIALVAQADRSISVVSTRILTAGGAGAAAGGGGGAAAGVTAGAITGGAIGLIGTPIGAVVGAGLGATIGGAIGLAAGAVGGATAGVGISHRIQPVTLTCTAEDIFTNLELSHNYRREGDRVMVEITGSFNCEGSHVYTLIREASQYGEINNEH